MMFEKNACPHKRKKTSRVQKLLGRRARLETTSLSQSYSATFCADTSYGPAEITATMYVPLHKFVQPSDVLHALFLGVVEKKLQFIENWLRCVFDVRPGTVDSKNTYRLFTLSDKHATGSSITLSLPLLHWNLIPGLISAELDEDWEIIWMQFVGQVIVSEPVLTNEEARGINQNSLLLLPESFQENWTARMQISELSLSVVGTFDAVNSVWSGERNYANFESSPRLKTQGMVNGLVGYQVKISASSLAQSGDALTIRPNRGASNMIMGCSLSNGAKYRGFLGPIASGYALYLDVKA